MSEFSGENDIFESLKRDLEDPYVVDFFDNLKTKQAEINLDDASGDFTDEQKTKIVNTLDNNWIYFGRNLTVSGSLIILDGDEVRTAVEDLPVKSRGFEVCRLASIDPEHSDEKLSICLVFAVEKGDGTTVSAVAKVDDVALEYPFPSQEKLEQRLDGDLLEYREQLDEIIFRDGPLEDVLKELASFEYEYETEGGQDKSATKALERYIDQVLDFDQQLPYYVVVEKAIHVVEGDKARLQKLDGELSDVAGVQGIKFYKKAITQNGEVTFMAPFVRLTHYSSQNGHPDTEYLVDVRNIKGIMPMRDDVDTEYFD